MLLDWGNGNKQALDKLTPLVYNELRHLAARQLRGERPDHTLQSTALVHEAYLVRMGNTPAALDSYREGIKGFESSADKSTRPER